MSCTSGLDSPPLAYSCDAPCLLGPTLPLRLTASSSSPRPWQRATPLEEASPCLNPPPRVPNSPHGPADGSKGRLFVSLDNFSIKQESAALQKSSSGAFTQIATSLGPFQLEGAMCIEHADSRSDNIDGINTAWGLSNAFCERSRPTPIMTDASKRYDDSDRQLSDPKTYSRLSVGPTDPIHSREKATSRCALEKPILTAALSKVSITPVKMSRAATSPAENAGIFRVPLTSDGLPTSESRAATGDLSHPKDYAKLAPVTSVRPSVTSCSDVMLSSRRRHGGESLVHTITMATENNIRPSVPSSGTASLQFPESNSPPPGRADLSPTHCPSIPTVLHRHHFLKQPPAPSVDGRMDARRTAKTNCSDGTRYQRTEDTVLPDPPAVAMVAHRDTTYHIDGQTSPSNQASLLSTAMVTSSASISPSSLACLYPSGDLSDSLTGLEAANTSDIVNWIDAFEKSLLGQQLVQNDVLASCDALTQSQRLDLTMHYIKPEHSQHSTQCVQSTSEEVELMFTTLEPKSNQLKYDERGINQTSEQEFPVDKVVEDSFNSDHWFQLEDLLDPLDPAFLNFLDENDQFGINLSARSDHVS
ncbi:unnamed protein product [Protopolystoma xenopodis]|uniref:Uncharacterized protein n=1 Tax=Protopolystoma xenopodis TaxID=117903 RepID=A0A448WET8_9PLAT|nr:unnamed protein product [Protopolystoma xenopodis]